MEEVKDVEQESSPETSVNSESLPEATTKAPAEATAPQAEQKETVETVPFNRHPRWQEVQAEKERARQEAEYWKQQFVNMTSKREEIDPDANLDPQTKVFYQDLEKRARKVAEEVAGKKEQQFQTVITRLAEENARIREKLFRQTHNDVQPGSEEEREIANLVAMGVPEDKAAWAVMGPKRMQDAERKGQVKVKDTNQIKAKANPESSVSIPATSGIPQKTRVPFRQLLEKNMSESGL